MNYLYIIGNGFDLAHGLKSSYIDFLNWYMIKLSTNLGKQTTVFENRLFKIEFKPKFQFKNSNQIIEQIIKSDKDFFDSELVSHSINALTYDTRAIHVMIKSNFIASLLNNKRWTDIERTYYNHLNFVYNKSQKNIKQIDDLNADFKLIKTEFIRFINEQNQKHLENFQPKNGVSSALRRSIESHRNTGDTLFLNFNYTDIFYKYISSLHHPYEDLKVLHIHGNTSDPKSIIFGYGDDTDENYSFLEAEGEDSLLINMKAFFYQNEINYNHLINFINSAPYNVKVIGHSLGLSDRVLLKSIFENKNLSKIQLYHRGNKESQFKKRIALSRHFENKQKFRSVLATYADNHTFPTTE